MWLVGSNKMLRRTHLVDSNYSFIEKYDDALSSDECNQLISYFENCDNKGKGAVTLYGESVINEKMKKCIQLNAPSFADKNILSEIILRSLIPCVKKYFKKNDYLTHWLGGRLGIDNIFAFKKFVSEDDGYKAWHTEHGPKKISERFLVWNFYLNDAKSGTEFMHYPNMDAKAGRCVIWPSGFTHMHRSMPNKSLKYIVSGWISFV